MRFEDLLSNILGSVIAALATLAAALVSQSISARRRRDRDKHLEEVDKIAGVVQTEEAARKAAVLERVVERVPVGLTTEQLATLVEEITARLPAPPATEVATAGAVEGLINNYHEQALGQAQAQFWFSIVAATVGFAWILFAGSTISGEHFASVSKILPGVVMDAVAFLFFRQASETRRRATELYDRLRRDKQMSESGSLVLSIEDERLRSAVKAQIALHMSGLQPNPIDLSTFLSSEYDTAEGGRSAIKKPGVQEK
jgi:uncharacterized membrane protein YhaH (DUF805 family)